MKNSLPLIVNILLGIGALVVMTYAVALWAFIAYLIYIMV